jgi:Leucine-rich repeat (LRR) protein
MKLLAIIFVLIVVGGDASVLNCNYKMMTYFGPFGNHYTCHAKNFNINCGNRDITSAPGSSSAVTQVYIDHQVSECIPQKLGDFYPNLKVLCVRSSKVEKISEGDLKGLGNLETLDLGWNNIKVVPAKMFEQTPRLTQLSIRVNKIVGLHCWFP